MKRRIKAGMVAATLVAGVLVSPGVAEASSSGCHYPQVCLYLGSQMRHPTGRFRDVTGGWQWLGRSFGARSFKNTRRDDVAEVLTTTGRVICVPPRSSGGLMSGSGGATAVRISWRSTC